jgi:hypothetical protein
MFLEEGSLCTESIIVQEAAMMIKSFFSHSKCAFSAFSPDEQAHAPRAIVIVPGTSACLPFVCSK